MKKILALFVIILFNVFLVFTIVNAQATIQDNERSLDNPLGSAINTPQDLIGQIIDSILGVVGSLALLMFVYGGIVWMTSSGNAEKVKKGRDILVWSAIGLVIVFSAYGLTRVLIEGLTG